MCTSTLNHINLKPATAVLLAGVAVLAAAAPDATMLWMLCGAPLAEELVFRAGLQQALVRPLGTVPAVLASSLAFTALHFAQTPTLVAALTLLPSLAIGAAYATSGRLRVAVVLHALFNTFWWLVGANALRALLPA